MPSPGKSVLQLHWQKSTGHCAAVPVQNSHRDYNPDSFTFSKTKKKTKPPEQENFPHLINQITSNQSINQILSDTRKLNHTTPVQKKNQETEGKNKKPTLDRVIVLYEGVSKGLTTPPPVSYMQVCRGNGNRRLDRGTTSATVVVCVLCRTTRKEKLPAPSAGRRLRLSPHTCHIPLSQSEFFISPTVDLRSGRRARLSKSCVSCLATRGMLILPLPRVGIRSSPFPRWNKKPSF